MRQLLHAKLAERYRAILFIFNRLKGDKKDIIQDLEDCRALKAKIDTLNDDDFQSFYDETVSLREFDWKFTVKNLGPLAEDRKALSEMFEKYGRCNVTLSEQASTAQVRFLSLNSLLKMMNDSTTKRELVFNSDKLAGYLQRITTPPV